MSETRDPHDDPLRAAQETIDRQQATIRRLLLEKYEPVAIVGIGIRFPGGNDNLDMFGEFLAEGRSGIRPLPEDRFDLATFGRRDAGRPEQEPGRIRAAAGGFLDAIDRFDPQFFNISPKEADYIDPQQRLLMQTAWEALENANIDPTPLRHGNGGVYVGASSIDYALELDALRYEHLDSGLATGITIYPLSGRLSYFLGWRGPSLSVDTACASSLTALHLAVEGLRRGECDIALCGAVNAIHHPRTLVMFSHGNMLAPDGRCKSFDEAADGYARAEGCGVLVLKRLSAARRDGDRVLALVRGTAIGQDGESAGLTVPNGVAQEAVTRAALAAARLTPGDIQYVEAHGTGTPLGDPIEMASIAAVFGAAHSQADPLTVGSLKSNLGHMEPAAGIGGVVKTVLQMRRGRFFPHLYQTPSGRIPWQQYPVRLPSGGEPWPAPVRRAVVNGFGFAGAIGVAVLEAAPPETAAAQPPDAAAQPPVPDSDGHILTLSAKSRPALGRLVDRYRAYLDDHPDAALADVCRTTNLGRAHFTHRIAGLVHDRQELAGLLDREAQRLRGTRQRAASGIRKAAFLFTGSGSQYTGMGRDLYRRYPVFREHVDECDRLFATHLGRSIRDLMFGDAGTDGELDEVRYTQPALFTLEYALAHLWMSWGIRPQALIGHSTGELVAATVAGVFPLADGVRVTAARARLAQERSRPGAMAAVGAPAGAVAPLLAGRPDLAIASMNSPQQCVLSGDPAALAAVGAQLTAQGVKFTPLGVSVAAHSPLMDPVREPLREVLDGVTFGEPRITVVSNVIGTVARPADLGSVEYWLRHLREPVNFEAGMAALAGRGRFAFIEIGPSTALTALATQCVDPVPHRWLTSLHRDDTDARMIRGSLAELYTAGYAVSWADVHAGAPGRMTDLPTYPFARDRYWLPNDARRHNRDGVRSPLLGAPRPARPDGVREFTTRISSRSPDYLGDHTLNGTAFVPAAAYLEAMLAAQDHVYGETRRPVRDIVFHEALFLTDPHEPVDLCTRVRPRPDGTAEVEIASRLGPVERRHVTAVIGAPGERTDALGPAAGALQARSAAAGTPDMVLTAADVYDAYARVGLDYGPGGRWMRTLARYGPDLAVGEVDAAPDGDVDYLPPPVSDSATHALAALVPEGHSYVAVGYRCFRLFRRPTAERLRAVLAVVPGEGDLCTDLLVLDADGPVFELLGMSFAKLAVGADRASGRLPAEDGPAGGPGITGLAQRPRPDRLAALDELIRAKAAGVLHIDDPDAIESGAKFVELGMNSLTAVELKGALEDALRVPLPPAVALTHPSPELLAEYVDRQLAPDQNG